MGLTIAISIVNWSLGFFFIKECILLFFTDFNLLIFHDNSENISEILNVENLLKTCIQTTYLIDFLHILQPFLQWEKNEKVLYFCKASD